MWNPISNVHRWTLTRLFFSENVSFVSDLLKLSKRRNDTASFRNKSEQLLSAEAESQSISSLPPSLSVSHWLTETNSRIWDLKTPRCLNSIKIVFKPATRAWWDRKSSLPLDIRFILRLHTGSMIILSSPPLRCWMLTMIYWHRLNLWFPSRLQNLKLLSHWLEAPSAF